MLPEGYKRNYKGILDGLMKAVDEGVLMRGSVANGAKLAAICSSMTNAFDWCKENSYFTFGPSWINRFWATAVAANCNLRALRCGHARTARRLRSCDWHSLRYSCHRLAGLPGLMVSARPGPDETTHDAIQCESPWVRMFC